ncbi:MAG: hypothetical protein NTW16_07600 [Bacteroidetes bacterium]|nr:hypothetical protein [Bacteroidota bacterium]
MIFLKLNHTLLSAILVVILAANYYNADGQTLVKQGMPVPENFCINSNEMQLYLMIKEYRMQHNLPLIPLSKSLSYIAALHAKDLFLNHPDQGTCNFHSWSNKGSWIPFCYPKDENKKNSVWDKPRELTKYPSKAYEIAYWENNPLETDTIIMVWKTEEYFNNFLLNTGKWQGKTWKAIGIAVYENYACAWFGETQDPAGEVFVCGHIPQKQVKDSVSPVDSAIVKPVISILPKDSASGTYYIIVKTNLSPDAANKLVKNMQTGDYPHAKVLNTEGKIRVSVFETSDKGTASVKLREVKKSYKDAWLYKR